MNHNTLSRITLFKREEDAWHDKGYLIEAYCNWNINTDCVEDVIVSSIKCDVFT